VGVFALAPAVVPSSEAQSQKAARRSPLQNIPVTGDVLSGGTFRGTLDIVSFNANDAGTGLEASGLLTGVLSTPAGNQTVTNELVTGIPVTLGGASNAPTNHICEILDLSIGPIDIDLLGLVIHLDEINLTIDAERGPGNLLGNLLCAIAGLLDGNPLGDVLNQIVGLLNRIIDLLG